MSNVKYDSELLKRLRKAQPDQVANLIDIITDFGRGRAGLDTDNKSLLVLGKKESEQKNKYNEDVLVLLIRELQEFGGDSKANLFRSVLNMNLIGYEEVLDDVYRKMNGSHSKHKTVRQKEREIALALFGEKWKSLPFKERYQRSTSNKILTGFFNIGESLQFDKLGDAEPDFVDKIEDFINTSSIKTMFTINAFSEAYRVTIPFVAQLGWMRLIDEEGDRSKSQANPGNTQPKTEIDIIGNINSNQILVLDEERNEIIKFSAFNSESYKLDSGNMTGEQLDQLGSLLALVPGASGLAELYSGNYVRCSIPLEQLTKIKDSTSFRGYVTGANKKFQEHAHLSDPENLKSIALSGFAWAAVSQIVAQKHLHDINEKLTEILIFIKDIKKELEKDKEQELDALLRYVQSLLDYEQSENESARVMIVLENHLATAYKLEKYFQDKLKEDIESIKDIKTDSYFSKKEERQNIDYKIKNSNSRLENCYKSAQLSIAIQALIFKYCGSKRYEREALKSLDGLIIMNDLVADLQKYSLTKLELTNSLVSDLDEGIKNNFNCSLNKVLSDNNKGYKETQQLYEIMFYKNEYDILLKIEKDKAIEGCLVSVDS